MSAKKSDSRRAPAPLATWLIGLSRVFQSPSRPVALGVLIVAIFVGLWYTVWRQVGEELLSSDDYWLSADDVEITPPPPWIHSDLRAEVFRDATLDGPLSILDARLTERIAKAFSLRPWVAEVRRVRKFHPARVQVELVYRRPVCVVTAPGGPYPVDGEGVLLPRDDFSPVEISRYPQLTGVGTVPQGPVGMRWGDPRVLGGAQIAAIIGPAWEELGLDRIVLASSEPGPPEEFVYELYTKGGTRIVWGRPPGADTPGEVPAADKLARLRSYKREHATLEGPRGPQDLDVRSLRSMHGAK